MLELISKNLKERHLWYCTFLHWNINLCEISSACYTLCIPYQKYTYSITEYHIHTLSQV